MVERVQKILSQWGIASRREAEKMILAKRVKLNGTIVELGQKIDTNRDRLEIDGQVIECEARPAKIYLLLNKPKGVISTCDDPQNRPTVLNLLSSELREGKGIHPVGRLDIDSTGALLLTNDGELTLNLTHPRYHLPKTYEVWVKGHPSESILDVWRAGVMLESKLTLPAQIKILQQTQTQTQLEIILTEGKNRQIRRVAKNLGFEVIELHRVAIGSISLAIDEKESLPIGNYRYLEDAEILLLQQQINLNKQNFLTIKKLFFY